MEIKLISGAPKRQRVSIPTPFGPVVLDVELTGEATTITFDEKLACRRMAEATQRALRERFSRGLDARGIPLPPLSPGAIRKRAVEGVPDTTTPMHATGSFVAGIAVEANSNGATVSLPTDTHPRALNKYGADRLAAWPQDAIDAALPAIAKETIRIK